MAVNNQQAKLDLAIAYLAMENRREARELLAQVVLEGTAEEQALASEQLSRLSTSSRKANSHGLIWWLIWLAWDAAGFSYVATHNNTSSIMDLIHSVGVPAFAIWLAGSVILLALAIRSLTLPPSKQGKHAT